VLPCCDVADGGVVKALWAGVTVCCCVLLCVTVCCCVLLCVTVCYSVLLCVVLAVRVGIASLWRAGCRQMCVDGAGIAVYCCVQSG
jgi:hypothetical protein